MEKLPEERREVRGRPDHPRHCPLPRGRGVPGGRQEREEQEDDQAVQVQTGHQSLAWLLCHRSGSQQRRVGHAPVRLSLRPVLEDILFCWVLHINLCPHATVLFLHPATNTSDRIELKYSSQLLIFFIIF